MFTAAATALPLTDLPDESKSQASQRPWGRTIRRPGILGQMALWPWLGFAGSDASRLMDGRFSSLANRGGSSAPEPEDVPAFYHEPVLMQEVLDFLKPAPGMFVMDATLGGGGHSEAILQAGANLVALDQDPVAIAHATARLRGYASRFCALRGNFRHFPELLSEIGVTQFDAILADIGVSSRQLDDASKGFSFMHDGPLDLRMNPDGPLTAADMVNTLPEAELVRILLEYGEEPQARRIARAIVQSRASNPIQTTLQLAAVIEKVCPRKGPRHPATLAFQALRIAVNDELAALQDFLRHAPKWLKPGGRLAIISFHSLEDRIVKRAFHHHAQEFTDRPEWPEPRRNTDFCLRVLTRRPVEATEDEIKRNPRSRSARLRVAERLPLLP
jgi:16S rRNA (cytosine1402-N4)-methyltransferase